MIHMVHVGVHGGTVADIWTSEKLARIGPIGVDQRLGWQLSYWIMIEGTICGTGAIELHIELTVHARNASVVVNDQSIAVVVMRLQLHPLFGREDAVERLSAELTAHIGEQCARIQRGIAGRLVTRIAIR